MLLGGKGRVLKKFKQIFTLRLTDLINTIIRVCRTGAIIFSMGVQRLDQHLGAYYGFPLHIRKRSQT